MINYGIIIIIMESQIDSLYDTLLRIENEEDNKALIDWLENVCQRHYGLIDGLVANFIINIDEPAYAKKLLRVLKYDQFIFII